VFLSLSLDQPLYSSNVAIGVEVKQMTGDATSWVESFGVIDGGLELMKYAWPSLDHKFLVRRNDTKLISDDGKAEVVLGHHWYPSNLLRKHPVDPLTVEQGHLKAPLYSTDVPLGKI
jgi:hypothetical protein